MENLFEPGVNMHKMGELLPYRVRVADQRLAFTDDVDFIAGRKAKPDACQDGCQY